MPELWSRFKELNKWVPGWLTGEKLPDGSKALHTFIKGGNITVDAENKLTAAPKYSEVTLTTSPTPLPAAPLEGRVALQFINTLNVDILLTDSDGDEIYPVPPDYPVKLQCPDNVMIYAKIASGSQNIKIMELK